jgi:YVTN family beta-propeller protein
VFQKLIRHHQSFWRRFQTPFISAVQNEDRELMLKTLRWKHSYLLILRTFVGAAVFGLLFAGTELRSQTGTGNWHANGGQQQPSASDLETPVRQVPDPGTITTRQTISPAGAQSVFESRVYGITFGSSSKELYAATAGVLYKLNWQSNEVLEKLKIDTPGLQGLTYDPSSQSALMTVIRTDKNVELIPEWSGGAQPAPISLGQNEIAEVAVSPANASGTRYGVVALTFNNEAAILDLGSGGVLSKVKTGIAPFGAIVDTKNTTAYVSNWGGRFPRAGDLTGKMGPKPDADRMVVDTRGIAASGTVSRIDLTTGKVTAEIEVGLHPTSLALDDGRHLLYVTNSNSDTISVIDTEKNAVVDTISVEPFVHDVAGIAPEALTLSRDGKHLYVACAGINAVAVFVLNGTRMKMEGLLPTGWYPDSIQLSPDGKYLAVGTLLGVGSGWKRAPSRRCLTLSPSCRYVHSNRGTIHVIPIPDASELQRYSLAVAENTRLQLKLEGAADQTEKPSAATHAMPVPLRGGDPSPIKHIIYVIKENRSYDQFFGSLGKGNGDPSLDQYADDVIPNHRKLARDFVLLDNFYATGGNSGDGHQWVTQANETDYNYLPGYGGRSYAEDGDPMDGARGGFIWNAAIAAGKSFIDFGEYTGDDAREFPIQTKERLGYLERFKNDATYVPTIPNKANMDSMEPYLVKDYPLWSLGVPDVLRARIFTKYLKQWETQNRMPDLVMVQLPADHTAGTRPGFSTPKACTADNDFALGMLVDEVSHSKFWESTLILVVEDDAQDGVDHVDGHRTVALAISPYIKRGSVDSTFYSQPSMLKTIELILGLKNMSLFDLIANDMRNSFQTQPDLTPYTVQVPKQSLYEVNPPMQSLSGQARKDAEASLQMNFSIPDAAPTEKLNRILWRDAKGWNAPYPKVAHAIFAPYSNDLDDDEKEERYSHR